MIKVVFISMLVLDYGYKLLRHFLCARQRKKPLPKSVSDIHNKEQYARWKEYQTEHHRLYILNATMRFVAMLILFSANVFSQVHALLPGNEFGKQCLLLCAYFLFTTLIDVPYRFMAQFKIEAKYGMNRCNYKTFITDCIRSFVINAVLYCGFCVLYMLTYDWLGTQFLWISSAVALVYLLVTMMLSSVFARVGNKLTPLQSGTLRDKLTELFSNEGYQLKDIYVMDASRRTTKANAACMGLGKLKQIVLYDNLINDYTEDEIVAVFAHELAHFKNHDSAKITLFYILNVLMYNAAMCAFFLFPQLSVAFGFAGTSAALAVLTVVGSDVFAPVDRIWQALSSAFIRPMEIRADKMAADCGYGEAMISFFKKCAKKDLGDLNPHPFFIAIEDEHPVTHKRIEAMQAQMKARKK